MGYSKRQGSSGAGGVLAVLAILAAIVLAAVAAILFWGLTMVRTTSSPPRSVVREAIQDSKIVTTEPAEGPIRISRDDVVVEIDRRGEYSIEGETMPLEAVQNRLQRVLLPNPNYAQYAEIRIEEGCAFEHVDKAIAAFQASGVEDPRLTTVPPRREALIEIDEQGQSLLDGEKPDPSLESELRELAETHQKRVSVMVRAHPQCPAEKVAALSELCRELGLEKVRLATLKPAEAATSED